jgi:hypothetical protein
MSGALQLPAAQEVSVPHDADQHPGEGETSVSSLPSYLPALPPESRASYRVASPDAELSEEIRLMRTVLAHLAEDIPANHRDIVHTVGVLARVTSLHLKGERNGP